MEIEEVDHLYYDHHFPGPWHVFAGASFNHLNAGKCEKVHYLLFKDSKIRLGLILGARGKQLYSPFSAPFGGFSAVKEEIRLQSIEEALILLKQWIADQGFASVHITLPPSIYSSSLISKIHNCFYRSDFQLVQNDLNYSFDLKNFDQNYIELIWRNARKNLNIALKNDFTFKIAQNPEKKLLAYQVIRENREARGFPLRMTWDQIQETIKVIKVDFFIVQQETGKAIAAAMVFHVAEKIVQVVYWGDLPDFAHLKTMNFLSYKVFEYYKSEEIRIIDIGPSTENSIPNFGLCEFKESIGCDITNKFTFRFDTICS